MTNEQTLLLNLIAKSLSDSPENYPIDENLLSLVDWKVLVRESRVQSIMYQAFESAKDFKTFIPSDVFSVWQNASMTVLKSNFSVFNDQAELVEILGDDYPYIILKGQAAGYYYNNPELRAYGDVDFLVDEANILKLEALLIENGYEKVGPLHDNHVVFKKGSANLEMHFRVAGIPFGKIGEEVSEFLLSAISSKVKRECEFGDFYSPNDLYHGLILLLHMQHHHLSEGLGLRHLCDWAVFVKQTANEPFWENTLIPFLKKIGLFTYASAMTKTCSTYFGTPCKDYFENVSKELCKEIILDVFKGGTFGEKDENRSKSGMLISEHGKSGTKHSAIYNLAHGLHVAVITQNKIVKKVWILYPFIYCYRAFRFLILSALGKKPKLSKMAIEAKERKLIYDKLKVFDKE